MVIFPMCVCLCNTCVCGAMESEEGVIFPGAGVTASCELPSRCWKLKLGFLEEQ